MKRILSLITAAALMLNTTTAYAQENSAPSGTETVTVTPEPENSHEDTYSDGVSNYTELDETADGAYTVSESGFDNFDLKTAEDGLSAESVAGADTQSAIAEDFEYKINENGESVTVTGYVGNDKYVVIPEEIDGKKVTEIANNAFSGNTLITSVSIPAFVTKIGDSAFSGCTNLAKINIPDGVTEIGDSAFAHCTNLENINYPRSLTKTGSQLFYGCSKLKSITVAEGVTEILPNAFRDCGYLEEINLPSTITKIGSSAFCDCTKLAKINIPDGVTEIGSSAFSECTNLENINYPRSLTNTGSQLFYGCSKLKSITVAEGVTEILPNAFRDCGYLEEINLPSTITKIGDSAFYDCTKLAKINIPDGVTEIGDSAFAHCTNLENINYPRSLTKTGSQLFYGCSKLKSITVAEGVTEILPNAFRDCGYLEEINLPSTITKIGSSAFCDCTKLAKINIPDGVTEIGSSAFSGCTNLAKINIPDGVTEIGSYAFSECTNLENINYPRSLTNTGSQLFYGCSKLKSITVAEGVTEILPNAFRDCGYLEEINLPSTITKIGDSAFYDCTKLAKINIPDGVTEIGSYAFSECTNLENINYPRSLKETGYCLFFGCSKLKSITVAEGVTEILPDAFDHCSYLEEINLPSTITKIGGFAFYGCTNLAKINIPDGVTEIGNSAFSGCSSLESVKLPEKIKLGTYVFNNCTNLTVYCPLYSETTLNIIRDNVVIEPSTTTRSITEKTVLDYDRSFYTSNFSSNTNSGSLSMICEYAFDAAKFKTLKNTEIGIYIPRDCICMEETLLLNGKPCKNYTLNSEMLTIPVTSETGRVTVSFKRTKSGKNSVSYALMNYTKDNSQAYDIIGIQNYNVPTVSLETGKNTNTATIKVSGIAPVSSTVEVFADDTSVGKFNSNKAGLYEGEITLPSPADNRNYNVKAQLANDESLYAEVEVNYSLNNPVVKEFTMTYNGRNYDLTSGKIYSITFASGYTYQFKIKFENYDKIDKVYVTSYRNGEKKYLEADWDEKSKSFITNGKFDLGNTSYVPGVISVEFSKPRQEFTTTELVDFYNETISANADKLPDYTVNQTLTADGAIEYSADLSMLGDLSIDLLKMTVKEVGKSADFDWGYISSAKNIYTYYFDKDSDKYFLNLDVSDPKTVVMYIDDIASNKVTKYAIDGLDEYIKDPNKGAILSEVTGILSFLGVAKDVMDIDDDYETLAENIYRSGMSSQQQVEALAKAKELQQDRTIYTVAMFAITTLMAGTGGLPFALLTGTFGVMSKYFFEIRAASILNGGYSARFNWCIDPSGYVYDAATGNRLADVKTTLYCIPYDENNENFWNETPDESKAVLWNASEYSQVNPIFTDADGNYAWDVPEGWWKVTYEKKGYKSAESEWLPVPPPQTNVNVGLKSVGGMVISGKIESSNNITSPVTIEILDKNGASISSISSDNGNYSINVPAAGKYTMRVSKSKHCPREYSVAIDGALNIDVELRLYGDINGDGKLTLGDVLKANASARNSKPLTGYDKSVADINGDGIISLGDVLKMNAHARNSKLLW